MRTIALAYSGGLDTSIIVPWLREHYDARVICVAADIGQGEDELKGVREKAIASGAEECYVEDLRLEYVRDFIWPTLRAGAIYNRKYLLGTSMARPLIAKKQVEVARKVGADALSHGCTGKGNDQVRFELTYMSFAPDLPVIAPWRMWDIKSREDALAYAAAHNVPVSATTTKIYSRDRNLWHISHEGAEIEDPAREPLEQVYTMTVPVVKAPNKAEYVELEFNKGVPVAVNGTRFKAGDELVATLNGIGGKHGVGQITLVENRLVGMKSRGVYETPGGTILYEAHKALEQLCLERDLYHYKQQLALKYGELVYYGQWFHPLREAMQAFVDHASEVVTGKVRVKLYKGRASAVSATSPLSLYDTKLASFAMQGYDVTAARGFIDLFGLPMKVRGLKQQRGKKR
jgi:argininosuccinate synthase